MSSTNREALHLAGSLPPTELSPVHLNPLSALPAIIVTVSITAVSSVNTSGKAVVWKPLNLQLVMDLAALVWAFPWLSCPTPAP